MSSDTVDVLAGQIPGMSSDVGVVWRVSGPGVMLGENVDSVMPRSHMRASTAAKSWGFTKGLPLSRPELNKSSRRTMGGTLL
jgi:hypothetical protein